MPKPITPLLTVDGVIFFEGNNLILIRRKNPPFQGELALPGGFVDIGETVEEACVREVYEETSLKVKIKELIGVYSKPERDPRGHTVSIAYLCVPTSKNQKPNAKDDAESLELIPLSELDRLNIAFDHAEIIADALKIKADK